MSIPPRPFSLAAALASTACLAYPFASMGIWIGLGASLFLLLIWLLPNRWKRAWVTFALLISSAGLAAVGLLSSIAPSWMISAAALALAAWDLDLLARSLHQDPSLGNAGALLRRHYLSLAFCLGLGLIAALALRTVQIQLSFIWVVLLAAAAFFALDRLWRALAD
ncbi:MAG TPA: hypothetical protein VMT46_00935 [Anaerolineaceae bacterium]|nr:hypothetical protein [Anaerolineaceae bacterium]